MYIYLKKNKYPSFYIFVLYNSPSFVDLKHSLKMLDGSYGLVTNQMEMFSRGLICFVFLGWGCGAWRSWAVRDTPCLWRPRWALPRTGPDSCMLINCFENGKAIPGLFFNLFKFLSHNFILCASARL